MIDVPVSTEIALYGPLQATYFGLAKEAIKALRPVADLTFSMSKQPQLQLLFSFTFNITMTK